MSKRIRTYAFLSLGVLALTGFLLPSATLAATFYIDPSAASNGNGTSARPFNTWNSVSFQRGNTYLQKAGTTYSGLLVLNSVQGTASLPVIIDRYGAGAPPSSQMLSYLIILHISLFRILPSLAFLHIPASSSEMAALI